MGSRGEDGGRRRQYEVMALLAAGRSMVGMVAGADNGGIKTGRSSEYNPEYCRVGVGIAGGLKAPAGPP